MKPKLSYTIWFTQRTGSQLLCRALQGTGIAGKPDEWLHSWLENQRSGTPAELQTKLWKNGSTANGVFALKQGFYEPNFSQLLEVFRTFPDCPPHEPNRIRIWEHAFPNHRHIFMTRRNKVRLAVSWWKAVQTKEWHRLPGASGKAIDRLDGYSFEAIESLYCQAVMREAGLQELFSEGGIAPLTLVYEDFILEYERTVRKVLEFLGLDTIEAEIPPPHFTQTADSISEEWVQRFRQERQEGWTYRGW
jgi:LPS sulfotransferase NodH